MRHGSNLDPPNRFESIHREHDLEHLEWDQEHLRKLNHRTIEYVEDSSQTIVSQNNSPDIPFNYSVNPYRGCVHACAYCYARPGHEFLGFNAGLDFETRIVVKRDAPQLLKKFLGRKNWTPEPIIFSGVTDCYQPAEREFRLTRQCLEIAWQCRQPIGIITKNALVLRDLDLLEKLAKHDLVHVYLSITTLKPELARNMEPRTSIPAARLRAVQALAEHQIPVGVMAAPIIPGLNDSEIPEILKAARNEGASTAGYILLRLPQTVEPVFKEWLARTHPDQSEKVLGRLKQVRDGKLNSSNWGERQVGTGPIADQINKIFKLFQTQLELDRPLPAYNCDEFRKPDSDPEQLKLF